MADIAFLATIVAFFMLCVGYIAVCGRIIGPDVIDDLDGEITDPAEDSLLESAA